MHEYKMINIDIVIMQWRKCKKYINGTKNMRLVKELIFQLFLFSLFPSLLCFTSICPRHKSLLLWAGPWKFGEMCWHNTRENHCQPADNIVDKCTHTEISREVPQPWFWLDMRSKLRFPLSISPSQSLE